MIDAYLYLERLMLFESVVFYVVHPIKETNIKVNVTRLKIRFIYSTAPLAQWRIYDIKKREPTMPRLSL